MVPHKVIDHIVGWLRNYADKTDRSGFVVGVSGGIDSAVTSTLCAHTGYEVTTLSMPIYQEQGQLALAHQHMNWLDSNFEKINKEEIELTPVFQSMENNFPKSIKNELTMANTRSRLRMLTLYAYASSEKKLVVGTGNKIEDYGVGFYTKYGDGGVDLSPIADLTKTEIYKVSEELGIINAIKVAAPTDGLWDDNRTDETQLGASYEELEWAMAFENGELDNSVSEESMTEIQLGALSCYRKQHNANRHKMDAIPVCTIPHQLKE